MNIEETLREIETLAYRLETFHTGKRGREIARRAREMLWRVIIDVREAKGGEICRETPNNKQYVD